MPTLNFKGKTAVENYHYTIPHHSLEFQPKLSLLANGDGPSFSGNLIVEGDNLIALKALLPTHAGRIKCVYMDPPYNTGNEGWVYNDNLTQPQFREWIGKVVGKEGEDASRHDKWCCMIYPRLQLARELLSPEGLILVSIDDNEHTNLKCLLDEIFGEQNFLGSIVWKTRNTDNRVTTKLSVDHEYVLVYSKSGAAIRGRFIDRSDFSNPDNDPRGPYVTDPLTGKATAEERPNLHYTVTNPKTKDKFPPDPARGWITDQEGFKELLKDNRVWWPPNPETGKPRKKRFLSETAERMPASSFWGDLKGQSGAAEVDEILGERLFAFPKSLEFMERLLDYTVGPEDVVLDPTGGSGTTAHAILNLNAKDGGKRKFVLIQMPYDTAEHKKDGFNIADKITAERVRRVLKSKKGAKIESASGFTYAKVGSSVVSEYRTFSEKPPAYKDLAQYIFYTETSQPLGEIKTVKGSHKIGEHAGASYYLLFDPTSMEGISLDADWLENNLAKDTNKRAVIYCEKIWVHRDDREAFEKRTGRSVRVMQLPFQLK